MSSKEAANDIIRNIYDRDRTDMLVEPLLVTVVLGSFFVFTVSYAASRFGSIQTLADSGVLIMHVSTFLTIGILILMSVFYLLMNRNEKHSDREDELRQAMISYLESINGNGGVMVDDQIKALRKIDGKIVKKENPPVSFKWGLIIALPLLVIVTASFTQTSTQGIPFLGLAIFLSFLALLYTIRSVTNFSYQHEKRWIAFLKPFHDGLSSVGIQVPERFGKQVGFRSFVLFFALTVLTSFLFMPIWAFLLLRDMNQHFVEQWAWENALVRTVRDYETGRA